ncbi:MAG: DUF2125 domain-containing protein [Boseongicola sp.]|nr:DUF2125 domain-containing protein [Boseongicola sp.]
MVRLIVVILVVALGWMIWWAFGSTALDRSLTNWVETRRADGWAADVGDIEVNGFPNRFDTTLTDVRFADPDTGVSWSAPFLQILSLAYRPNQVIAALPNEHTLSTPLQTLDFTNSQARGSIYLQASPSLPLDRSSIVVDELKVASSKGWDAGMAQARFATELVPARKNAHRIGAEILELQIAKALKNTLDPAGILPDAIERLHFDADVGLTGPLDRHVIEDARPQITDIDLRSLAAAWGDVNFKAVGKVTVDEAGTPTGELTVKAVEWRRLLTMAVETGVLPEAFAPSVERSLELLAALKGPPDTIDATLEFRGGLTYLGLIPIGPAPDLTIR